MKRVNIRHRNPKFSPEQKALFRKADVLNNVSAIVQSGVAEHLKLLDGFGPSSVSKLRGMAAMLETAANRAAKTYGGIGELAQQTVFPSVHVRAHRRRICDTTTQEKG